MQEVMVDFLVGFQDAIEEASKRIAEVVLASPEFEAILAEDDEDQEDADEANERWVRSQCVP